jgi:hypothetical protein
MTLEDYKQAILDLGVAKGETYFIDALEQQVQAAFVQGISPAVFVLRNRDSLLVPPAPAPAAAPSAASPQAAGAVPAGGATNLRQKEMRDLMHYSCIMKVWAAAFWWSFIFLFLFLYLQHGSEMRVRQLCLEEGIDGTEFITNMKSPYYPAFVFASILGTIIFSFLVFLLIVFEFSKIAIQMQSR